MKTRIIRRGDAFGGKIAANGQIISCECIAPTDRIIALKYDPAKPLPQIHSINGIIFIVNDQMRLYQKYLFHRRAR